LVWKNTSVLTKSTRKSAAQHQNGRVACPAYIQPVNIGHTIPHIPFIEVLIPMILPACFPASFARSAVTDGQNDPIPSGKSISIKNTSRGIVFHARKNIPKMRKKSHT
jgi:hypothetical protein